MGVIGDLAKALIKKLTKKQLHLLCEIYDDGSIEDLFFTHLYPEDKRNYPQDYAGPDDSDIGDVDIDDEEPPIDVGDH